LIFQLHDRAAGWYEANGLAEDAIGHAQAARDADRVARLVASMALPVYAGGRADTVRHWIGWFQDQRLIEAYPLVAVQGALLHMMVGQPAAAERWADAAERGLVTGPGQDPGTLEALLALLQALLSRHGVEQMRADAVFARERLGSDSLWRAACDPPGSPSRPCWSSHGPT
jgi:LuxR family maltose regulon positive regulatory protein